MRKLLSFILLIGLSQVVVAGEIAKDFFDGTKYVLKAPVEKENLPYTLGGLAIIGGGFALDGFDESDISIDDELGDDLFGVAEFQGPVIIGTYLLGEINKDPKLKDTAIAALHAEILTGVVTHAMKHSIRRKRPDSNARTSFPSGHTSSIFSLAATYSCMSDWNPIVTTTSFGIAIYTGLSRIEGNDHHTSDVIAGAVIGTTIGYFTAKYYKEKKDRKITLEPSNDGMGVALVYRF